MSATTILVLSLDAAPMLAYSLPAAELQEDAELVVIDNGCRDQTPAMARRHGARVIRIRQRVSYAAAMNIGLSESRAPAVLILDPGCLLDPGFLAAARPWLEEDDVGSVAGKLLRTAGPLQDGPPQAIAAAGLVVDRRRRVAAVGHGAPADAYATRADCFGAAGTAALYRRDVLARCALAPRGGDWYTGLPEIFDEDMERWGTDADLAWRARLLGFRCVYEPAATARHVRPAVSGPAGTAGRRRQQLRNRYVMWAKNETRQGLLHDLPAIVASEAAGLGQALLRERNLLAGYRDLRALLPAARERRAEVQSRRLTNRVPFGLEPAA